MMQDEIPGDEGCYVISIAARMVGMHQQTLRYYERMGLIEPSRSRGNIRLYSPADIGRLRQIQRPLRRPLRRQIQRRLRRQIRRPLPLRLRLLCTIARLPATCSSI